MQIFLETRAYVEIAIKNGFRFVSRKEIHFSVMKILTLIPLLTTPSQLTFEY